MGLIAENEPSVIGLATFEHLYDTFPRFGNDVLIFNGILGFFSLLLISLCCCNSTSLVLKSSRNF